jgi:hypothetical protein
MVALASLVAVVAAESEASVAPAPHSSDEAPSLLRKFHVHYQMPTSLVDIPQDSAGAGMSAYGGVFRTLLMISIFMFSVSQFFGSSAQPALDSYFADEFEELDHELAEYDAPFAQEEVTVAEVLEVEAPLDHQSCILLAQNVLFADDAAAAALAERCWRMDKRARIVARAEQLLRLRSNKHYSDIGRTLDPHSFEVFDRTPNWNGATVPKYSDTPVQDLAAAAIDYLPSDEYLPIKLSAHAIPFYTLPDENTPTDTNCQPQMSLLDRPTGGFRNQQKQQQKTHLEPPSGNGLLDALAALPVVALAVHSTSKNAAARRTKRKTATAFPTNQHKSKPKIDRKTLEVSQQQRCFLRNYDVLRSA